jgi:hypothetical protein
MTEVLAAIVMVVAMSLFDAGSLWYFRRIRQGRADPLVNPSWTTTLRPPPVQLPESEARQAETSLFYDPTSLMNRTLGRSG